MSGLIGKYLYELLFAAVMACVAAIWAGLKKWREQGLQIRPTVSGYVSETTVGKAEGLRFDSNKHWEVALHYQYSVEGKEYVGVCRRGFEGEVAAWEFADAVDEQTVQVHYRREKPSTSGLVDSELQTLVESSSSHTKPLAFAGAAIEPLFPYRIYWLVPLMVVALVGFLLSLFVYIESWMGKIFGLGIFSLHVFMFLVFAPAVLIVVSIGKKTGNTKNIWKDIFGGLPPWVKYCAYGLFGLAMITSILSGSHAKPVTLGFASAWMIFYGLSFSIYWSAYNLKVQVLQACSKGHLNSKRSMNCADCGRPLWRLIGRENSVVSHTA
jgi:hypothetical protein